ncbi:MAG: hypothetical protein MJZ34_02485 [Paludibacteraceae bacterium]|nr:hypothetical protein [Paludibacteraceae bacterium]
MSKIVIDVPATVEDVEKEHKMSVQQTRCTFKELEIIVPVKYVESVNKLNTGVVRYTSTKDKETGRMYNKAVPGVMLTPEARSAMHDYFSQLERYAPKHMLPKMDCVNLDITFGFYISGKTYRRRDNDNMVKIFF